MAEDSPPVLAPLPAKAACRRNRGAGRLGMRESLALGNALFRKIPRRERPVAPPRVHPLPDTPAPTTYRPPRTPGQLVERVLANIAPWRQVSSSFPLLRLNLVVLQKFSSRRMRASQKNFFECPNFVTEDIIREEDIYIFFSFNWRKSNFSL